MASVLRAGIIGAGGISGAHIPVLRQMEGVSIRAVCDIRPERARAAAESCGAEALTDWHELVRMSDIDVVHVLTPHCLHAEMAIAALENGKHALTEKPMASELNDARRMIAAGDMHPELKLGVIFQNRYNPATVELKAIIDSGEMGAVLGARASVCWHREPPYYHQSGWRGAWATEGGGVLINQAIHTLDLLSYLGGEIARVRGHVSTIVLNGEIEVEDNACAVAEYASGARAVIHATNNYVTDAPILLEIALEKATYQLLGDKLLLVEGGVPRLLHGGAAPIVAEKSYWGAGHAAPIVAEKSYWGAGHAAQIADYYHSVRTGEPVRVSARGAFPALNLVKAIYASSASGDWVNLERVIG